ncbi:LPXTG cell wall anchor domain-containing protein [Promicromonospora sp. Marseille-Q5078]
MSDSYPPSDATGICALTVIACSPFFDGNLVYYTTIPRIARRLARVCAGHHRRDNPTVKRTMAGVVATTLAVGGMLVATAAPASAHTRDVNATCDTLSVSLKAYQQATVTVVIDDERVVDNEYFEHDYPATNGAKTFPLEGAMEWSVTVDAHDDDQWDKTWEGSVEPCEGTPEQPEQPGGSDKVQVGIYLYEKLDAIPEDEWRSDADQWRGKDKPARWENSGEQQLLATKTLDRDEVEVGNGDYWYTELPETDLLENVDLCTDWGIQQDLVPGDYTIPQNITYPDDDSGMSDVLLDNVHQELEDLGVVLPGGESCGPEQPPVEVEPTVVVPMAPTGLEVCGSDASDVILPANSAEVTYTRTDDGVLATPTTDHVFGEDLGGYTLTMSDSVLFPIADLVPAAEDCALIPGDIAAVCQGETPYLDYGVSLPEGIEVDDDTPLTITFINPDGGEDFVAEDQPLEGSLLWPGASDTAPKQWPGWEQQDDGSYVETDGNYAWTRDDVQVRFEVNPEYSQIVSYPEATTQCANPIGVGGPGEDVTDVVADADVPAADAAQADELPQTGATVGLFAGLAALLVAGGGVLFWLRRRLTTSRVSRRCPAAPGRAPSAGHGGSRGRQGPAP